MAYGNEIWDFEQLLTDVYKYFRVEDFEEAAKRVSVLFTPPFADEWKPKARRSFRKLRRKLEDRYGKHISSWHLSKRGVEIIAYTIASSILQHLGFSSFPASKVALVVGGAAAKMFKNLVRGWRRCAYAAALMYAAFLEEGFGVPRMMALEIMALATAIAFYIVTNPSVVEELYTERVEAR
ncbi:MAG: hypothetical protein QXR12_04395 [Thermofilum sp.]